MAGGMKTWIFAVGLLTVALSGCTAQGGEVTPAQVDAAYKDADSKFKNHVGGVEDTTKTFDVAAGSSRLTVKALYHAGGVASFTLKNPAGTSVQEDEFSGGKTVNDDEWYAATSPLMGTWRLEIEISGGADYAFGVYVEP